MSIARNTLIGLVAVATVFVSGLLIGSLFSWGESAAGAGDQSETTASPDDHGDAVILTRDQRKLIELRLGRVTAGPYIESLHIPATIVEKPGRSNHVVSTTVNGIITKIHAIPGQVVRPGDPLFEVRLTGEALASAQADLLGVLKQIEVTQAELDRITPLAQDGGVAGKQKLELEYRLKELRANRDVRSQELLVRGLSATQLDDIVSTSTLLRDVTIRVPDYRDAAEDSFSSDAGDAVEEYAIEELKAYPGLAIRPGDDLCHLAWHTELYVQGQAFEQEVDQLAALDTSEWNATIEVGLKGYEKLLKGFQVLYIDNHVDTRTQTFRFYIPIRNEVFTEKRDPQGRLFRSWRFKPGQRVHVGIPLRAIEGHFPVPAEAVVEQGVSAFVFRGRVHEHPHDEGEEHDHAHGEEMEFSPVPVKILRRDTQIVLIDAGGDLKAGDSIALNKAFQLYVALKSGAGDAGHDHHGHSH